tara:strand:- start:1345 stop:1638 length:294 start_codon:yes stop_codon:yes gene_type:complete
MAINDPYEITTFSATGARQLANGSNTTFVDGTTVAGYTGIPPTCRALYIGTGGNMQVTMADGATVQFFNIADGTLLPIQVSRVYVTNTTCNSIHALF